MAVDILVTGGSGVLGRELVKRLRVSGYKVVACCRTPSPAMDAVWDVTSQHAPQPDCSPQMVVHAAACIGSYRGPLSQAEALFDVNVTGTLRVATWCGCKKVARLVLISGAIVYGEWDREPKSETALLQPWAAGSYAVSKYCSELVVQLLAGTGCAVSILRLSSLYGAGYNHALIPRLLREGRDTGKITVAPPLDDGFDLLHVTDAARTIERSLSADRVDLWNVGGGRLCTLAEIVNAIAKETSAEIVLSDKPADRPPRILNWVNDQKARRDLQHVNQTEFRAGIREIARSMQMSQSTLTPHLDR